ncbi:Kae1-like domain-containing protein [Photobacterium toruni]|uniref:Carbamoyltransferase Kae1-like domain-containing protein n=1 Tax=Photobacterium toruni TaxID=1935446 RepID=A0A1T4SYW1_9GAMM|nr:hypothetical protein [Photobacterium toruni]SKA33377.1 hypothetical protein CZ814_01846 [Photobacterium toruni]
MKLIQFSFTCSRPVPFYAQLCNDYLANQQVEITIAYDKNRYLIEAVGTQPQLEALADQISKDFLLSIWLIDSSIKEIRHREGRIVPLITTAHNLPFCSYCEPTLGDNQSELFGEVDITCSHCHGEKLVYPSITREKIQQWAETVMNTGHVSFSLPLANNQQHDFHLSRGPIAAAHQQRQQVIICNPNNVPMHFIVPSLHVLALSSLEKPRVAVRAKRHHAQLDQPMYDLCFSYNRVLTILTEILRVRGIDYLHIETNHQQPLIARINKGWSQICSDPVINPLAPFKAVEPLHDQACINGLNAYWSKRRIHFDYQPNHTNDAPAHTLPICALHGGMLESGVGRHSAVIYFGRYAAGEIVSQDRFTRTDTFLTMPTLPQSGSEIIAILAAGEQAEVLAKFKYQIPVSYNALNKLVLNECNNQLSGLFALVAAILGLSQSGHDSVQFLNDALIAKSLQNADNQGHRVDFPLDMVDNKRTIDWAKMLGSLMSFCLVVDEVNYDKLAFGVMDSLADYIANWIERMDETTGIKAVTLAGSDFANEVLADRICLRVGKNFPIVTNRKLELDGSNLSAGALFLKMRRR